MASSPVSGLEAQLLSPMGLDSRYGVIMDSRAKLLSILSHLDNNILAPSDVVVKTGLPRYEVLGAFHTLEALGIVSVVHSRNNYKLYTLSELGKRVLEILMRGDSLEDLAGLGGSEEGGSDAHSIGEVAMSSNREDAAEASSS